MTATATTPIKVLLQTTIPFVEDDWNIGRFGLLRDYIAGLKSDDGQPLAEVTARDREPDGEGIDPILNTIDTSDFDQVWIFGVELGGGISAEECRALTRFRQRGGAILATRDHQDLGSSVCDLGGVGKAHYFHTKHPDPDPSRRQRDDPYTQTIDYPNFHSGSNGDVQRVTAEGPVHPVLVSGDGTITLLPAHPHEGDIGAPPDDPGARVVLTGRSQVTGRPFNIAVAFESLDGDGRGWAESSFHHFVDYNWDISAGCPSFLSEPPSDRIAKNPALLDDTKRYVRNIIEWLGRRRAA
ncbi:MAG TPA: hypothetical protein VE591_04415 [Candidatus Acidoferrum sp.]|jgi:hypothetical protein|nr:hypothetical protein [Candidatus Acidoferrum sp.]